MYKKYIYTFPYVFIYFYTLIVTVVKTDDKSREILSGVKFKIKDKATDTDIVFKEYVGGKIIDKIEFTTDEYGEFITPSFT